MMGRIPGGGRAAAAALGLVVAVLLTGCSSQLGQTPTAPVKGKVTWKGQPVAAAMVVFTPEQQGIWSAQGFTDESGQFTLNTYGTESRPDGAAIGKCKVSITKQGPPPPRGPKPPGIDDVTWTDMPNPGKSVIPEKYSTSAGSGLVKEVKNEKNYFEIVLEGDAPP